MDQERRKRLDEIDFVISASDQDKDWNLHFKKMHDYYERPGHCKMFCAVDRFPSFSS
jgi:hypothetical protein